MQKLYSPAESPEITSPEGGPNADALIIFTGPSSRGWHRLQVAAECLQKYAWNYEGPGGKIDISKRPPLITGSLIHLVLAQHYSRMKQEQLGLNPEEYMDPVEAVRFLADAQGNSAYVDDVLETYEVYRKQFYSDIRNMQIEAVETLFEGFITSDKKPDKKYLLTGRIDLLYRDMGGQLWCCDHKCVPSNSTVLTPTGPITVGELVAQGLDWTCCAWDSEVNSTVWAKAYAPKDAGIQDVHTIQLSDGTQEKYGYKHPILTEQGWKKACAIEEGDWVAVSPPAECAEKELPDALLTILGIALSDGSRVKKKNESYVITAQEEETRSFICAALDALGDSWALHKNGGKVVGVRLHAGGQARKALDQFSISGSLSIEKVMPSILLSLSQRQAGLLLGALWEGDGSAYLGTAAKNGNRPLRLVFSSRSDLLAYGVRHLLLQLGIISNVTESRVVGAPYYQTIIVGYASKLRFLQAALAGLIRCPTQVKGGGKTRKGRSREGFLTLLDAHQKNGKEGEKIVYPSAEYIGRGRTKNPRWENGIRWVKVTSNVLTGQERCYDIEVPKFHTFLMGSCVVTHNTTSRLTNKHREYFGVSGQMLAYEYLVRQRYPELAGFKINLIQHASAGVPKFERVTVAARPLLEKQFADRVIDIEEAIERVQAEGRALEEWPKAMSEMTCFTRYGACDFVDKCRFGAKGGKSGSWSWED